MNEELKKYQDLVSGLMRKLDAERQRASRLEHELSQYHEGKSLADQLAEKDDIINRQKRTIDKLNAQLDWLKRKVWGGRQKNGRHHMTRRSLPSTSANSASALKRKGHTGRPMRNSKPIISNARMLPKSAGPRTGLPAGPYLTASGASALTSIPKGTTMKSGNCSQTNSAKERSSSIASLPNMSPSNTSSTRQSARTTSRGQSGAQQPHRHQSPRAMRVQPSWPT